MSWFEAKIHKRAASHLLQNFCFGDLELAADGGGCSPPSGNGFQVLGLVRPEGGVGPAGEGRGDSFPGQAGWSAAPARAVEAVSETQRHQEKRLNEVLGALAEGFAELSRLRGKVLNNSTEDMLRLVLAVAEQVIHCEVKADPTIIVSTLHEALQAAIASDSYHVKVHPDDLAIVMEKKPLFMASISGLKNITLEADAAVEPGGCLVESELGQVDATIGGQLEEIRHRLLATVDCRGEGGKN